MAKQITIDTGLFQRTIRLLDPGELSKGQSIDLEESMLTPLEEMAVWLLDGHLGSEWQARRKQAVEIYWDIRLIEVGESPEYRDDPIPYWYSRLSAVQTQIVLDANSMYDQIASIREHLNESRYSQAVVTAVLLGCRFTELGARWQEPVYKEGKTLRDNRKAGLESRRVTELQQLALIELFKEHAAKHRKMCPKMSDTEIAKKMEQEQLPYPDVFQRDSFDTLTARTILRWTTPLRDKPSCKSQKK